MWDGNIRASVVNRREFAEIWEDRGRIDVSMGVTKGTRTVCCAFVPSSFRLECNVTTSETLS